MIKWPYVHIDHLSFLWCNFCWTSVLQSMGSQTVRHDVATEQQYISIIFSAIFLPIDFYFTSSYGCNN